MKLRLLALFLLFPMSSAFAVDYQSVRNAAVLYDSPSFRGVKRYIIKRDTPVEVLVILDQWVKVRDAEGGIFWIEKKNLAARRTLIVTAPRAEIRRSAEESSPIIFEVEKDVALDFLGKANGVWLKVRHKSGQEGFVRVNQVWGG